MAKVQRTRGGGRRRPVRLGLDQALVALFIGAMNANGHVAADEAARAHHLIWSTRRFRGRSGDAVGKLIEDMRALLEREDADTVMETAARTIPARLRQSVFAVLADLLLADGRLEAQERRFLLRVGEMLAIEPATLRRVIDVVLLKNRL